MCPLDSNYHLYLHVHFLSKIYFKPLGRNEIFAIFLWCQNWLDKRRMEKPLVCLETDHCSIVILPVRQQLGSFGNHFEWEHPDVIDSVLLVQLKLVPSESFLTWRTSADKSMTTLIAPLLSLVEHWILLESILYLLDTYYSHLCKYLLILKMKQTSKNQDTKL